MGPVSLRQPAEARLQRPLLQHAGRGAGGVEVQHASRAPRVPPSRAPRESPSRAAREPPSRAPRERVNAVEHDGASRR